MPPFVNNTGAVLFDAHGNIIQPGQIQINDGSQVPLAPISDTLTAEQSLVGLDTGAAVAFVNAMSDTPGNILILQAVIDNSEDSDLVAAAQAQMIAWGVDQTNG